MGAIAPTALHYKAVVLGNKRKMLRVISPYRNCSETIIPGSLVCRHILQLRQRLCFAPDYLLRTFTQQITSENSMSLQTQGQACFLPILKDLGSLNLRLQSCDAPCCHTGIIQTSMSHGNCDKNATTLAVITCLLLT